MEESKDSSDESDRTESVNKDDPASKGRFYECTFCRRGFSTAQALGGHMNIHRRDRARMHQPLTELLPPVPDKPFNDTLSPNPGFLPPQLPNYPFYPSAAGYHGYLPTSTSTSSRHTHELNIHGDYLRAEAPPVPQRQLSLFGEEPGSRAGGRAWDREEKKDDDDDDELDLELRLGHEP